MAHISKVGKSYKITVYCGTDYKGRKIKKNKNYRPLETAPSKIEKEVQAAAAEFERAVLSGKIYDGENILFYEFVENSWIPGYVEKNLSPGVIEDYKRKLKNWIYPALGGMKLSKITVLHISHIYDDMLNKGRKAATIHRYNALLNDIFKYAYKSSIIQENPCSRCTLPKDPEKYKYQIWTPEQVDTFFQALKSSYTVHVPERIRKDSAGNIYKVSEYDTEKSVYIMYIALYTLCIYSSARRGEIAALTWEDIDFSSREIFIRKAAINAAGKQIIKAPKTAAGKRRVTLPANCFKILHEWRKAEMELSMQLGSMWQGYTGKEFDKNYVFIQRDSGKMIFVDTITQKFKKIVQDYNATCKNAADKLPEIRLHDLRHTGASLLIAAGEDIVTVSHRLGHAKPSTTMDIYSHALPLKDKEASDRLEKIISG